MILARHVGLTNDIRNRTSIQNTHVVARTYNFRSVSQKFSKVVRIGEAMIPPNLVNDIVDQAKQVSCRD